MQDRREAGEERWRKGGMQEKRVRKGKEDERRFQEQRFAGKEKGRKCETQERRNIGNETRRKGRMHEIIHG